MTRADDQVALDETVADPATIVRALVFDDDELAASEARDRDGASTVPRCDNGTDGHETELVQLRSTIIGVVPELVDQLVNHQCFDRAHASEPRRLV